MDKIERAYVLNIERHIGLIEKIFDKYIPVDEHMVFTIGMRYPVSNKWELTEVQRRHLSRTPYMPYKCVSLVTHWLLTEIYKNSTHFDVYKSNKYLKNGGRDFIEDDNNDLRELLVLNVPGITLEDVNYVCKLCSDAYELLLNYIPMYTPNIYEFGTEYAKITLIEKTNLYQYRYEEKLKEIEGGE